MAVPSLCAKAARGALRRELRQRRLILSRENTFPPLPPPALDRLLAGAKMLALYVPMTGEPDPLPLATHYSGATALPHLTAKGPMMDFRRWQPGDPTEKSVWGGTQPWDDAPNVEPDVIFVPLLGFDAAFHRIGQGGGHYDRYLAAHPAARRIGIAWEGQRIASIEAEEWDIPLDAILTEAHFHIKDLNR